jgi:hypothetical protein
MGMSWRNFAATGIIAQIQKDYDVIIITASPFLAKDLASSFDVRTCPRMSGLLAKLIVIEDKILFQLFFLKYATATMTKYVEKERQQTPLLWRLRQFVAIVENHFSGPWWNFHRLGASRYKNVVRGLDTLICLSFDVTADKLLMLAAEKSQVPVMLAVHSWDNLPARGFIPTKPFKLLVWNEAMIKQALNLHGIPATSVELTGVPQFQHMRELAKDNRDISFFYENLKAKKFFLYCASASRVFPDEAAFINLLSKACKTLEVNLVVRLHPFERGELYRTQFADVKHIVFDQASGYFAAALPKQALPVQADDEFLRFTFLMRDALGVINLASTTSLDAMATNTPVLCPTFNVDENMRGQWNEAGKWYTSDHFKPVAESGAVHLAKDMTDVLVWMEACKNGDTPHASEAHKFVTTFAPPINPAQAILKALGEIP